MIAYTAWDSLQTIARQFDGDLALTSGSYIELAPRRARSSAATAVRRLADRVRGRIGIGTASGRLV